MAIAPFVQPLYLDFNVVSHDYTNGCTLVLQAFVPNPKKGPQNIATNSIISWSIDPLTKDFGTFTLSKTDGTLLNFNQGYLSQDVSTVVIKFTQSTDYTNVSDFDYKKNLFSVTVNYLPFYNNNNYTVGATMTKYALATSPIKVFSNDYLVLKNTPLRVNNISLKGLNAVPNLSATITSDNNNFTLNGNNIRNDFNLTYNTNGIKNIFTTVYFPSTFCLTELHTNYLNVFNVIDAYEDYKPSDSLRFAKQITTIGNSPHMPPNEWVTDDTINSKFRKIYDAIEYIRKQSKIVRPVLGKKYGWYDSVSKNWNYYIDNINTGLNVFKPLGSTTPINDSVYTDNEIFLVYNNIIKECKKDYNLTENNTLKGFNDLQPFIKIKNIAVDSNKKLFVLDTGSSRVGIFKKNFTRTSAKWTTELFFGGIGTRAVKDKFFLPNSLFLDQLDNFYVVDTGNNCIKKYSNDGTWLDTIASDDFTGNIIDGVTDRDFNYHILTPTQVIKLDPQYSTIKKYNLYNPVGIPLRIIPDVVRDFILVVYSTKIQKYYKDGTYVGTIYGPEASDDSIFQVTCQDLYGFYWSWDALSCALELDLNQVSLTWTDTTCNAKYKKRWMNETTMDATGNNYNFNVYGANFDPSRNFYIIVGGYLLKYTGNTTFLYLYDRFHEEYYWDIKDILINKEDFVQDWTYNKSFQRLWDNIEIVKTGITHKFVPSVAYQSTPFNAYDITKFNFIPKDDIIIGQNEIVTTDVINRVIDKLWHNIAALTSMINYRDTTSATVVLTATDKFTQITA